MQVSSQPKVREFLRPRFNKYIPQLPTSKQQAFLLLPDLDAFYGGQAGGGKSSALLMAALQYVDIPGYAAILIRDTYKNLTKPEALIDRSFEWLSGTDAHWNGEAHTWTFPNGSSLGFGYLDGPRDHLNYQSAAYQFIGIDEIVAIRENQALYMFSRLRRLLNYRDVPLRFRCASNPPTREQVERGAWVKRRYVDPATRDDRVFIPARMDDNPYLDREEYNKSLAQLDPITRAQLRDGNWEIKASGGMFKREDFHLVDTLPKIVINRVRYWDLAATEVEKGKDPAYTVGLRMSETPDGLIFIESVVRDRLSPRGVETIVRQIGDTDGREVYIGMEQEPGSSGKLAIHHFRKILRGFTFKASKVTISKESRLSAFASQVEAGNVCVLLAHWTEEYLDEMDLWPFGFKDQGDASGGAYNMMTGGDGSVVPDIRQI